MTSQELQIKVAEMCGWRSLGLNAERVEYFTDIPLEVWNKLSFEEWCKLKRFQLPPFSTSLDAIQAACLERFTTQDEAHTFMVKLILIACTKLKPFWQLTAADWCEAFLVAVNEIEKK